MGWDNDQWGGMHDWNGHGYYGVGMGIFFLILIGLAVWAIVRVSKRDKSAISNSSSAALPNKETPREILDRRFANGEINPDEYQRAKDLLSQ